MIAGAVATSTAAGWAEEFVSSFLTLALEPPQQTAHIRLEKIAATAKSCKGLGVNIDSISFSAFYAFYKPSITRLSARRLRSFTFASLVLFGRANPVEENVSKVFGRFRVGNFQETPLRVPKIIVK